MEIRDERIFSADRIFTYITYIFLTLMVIACLYPFLNVLAYSLSSTRAILSGWVTFYPIDFQVNAYKDILSKGMITQALKVSIIVTAVGTLLGIFLTVCASYSLSKKRLKGRAFLTGIIVLTMYVNGGIIPTFLVVKNVGLLDSIFSLVIPVAMNAFNFIVMRSFFQQIPESLEEAAILDGCGDLKVLTAIILPLSKPIIATIGLFYAVAYWNDYFASLMYIQSPTKFPMQLLLRQLIFTEALGTSTASEGMGQQVMPEALKAACVVVSIVPIILIYPWLQKYFVKGVMLGSVKG